MSIRRPLDHARRRSLKALGLLALGAGGALAQRGALAQGRTLPLSSSLQDELAQALKARQPLVVMVSLHRCPWCEEVRNNYLAPMQAQEGLPVVQVDMLSPAGTRTVQGEPITHDALVRGWKISMAPTVLFLGAGGKEVAERLVGGSPDFYAAYLDNRLAQARKAING